MRKNKVLLIFKELEPIMKKKPVPRRKRASLEVVFILSLHVARLLMFVGSWNLHAPRRPFV